MAKKKVSHQSKQEPQSQPPLPIDDDKLQNLKNLNSLLLKETSERRQQVQSLIETNNTLESSLNRSNMQNQLLEDDTVVSELEKSIAFDFIKSQVTELGFLFASLNAEKNDMERVVTQRGSQVEVLEGEVDELKSNIENERVRFGKVSAERDLMKHDFDGLKEKLLETENRERKLLEEGEKLLEEGFQKERVIGEVMAERDFAIRNSEESAMAIKELKGEMGVVVKEKDEILKVTDELKVKISSLELELACVNGLKEKLLESESRERKLLEETQKLRSEGEKLMEEGFRKERAIREAMAERDSALRNSRESAIVIDELKAETDVIVKEKNEILKLVDEQKVKINSMELELTRVNEDLYDLQKHEELMRGKIVELEGLLGLAVEKEEGMMLEIRDLMKQKEEMEGSIEMLKERRDSVQKVLDVVQKEFEDKQREIGETIRAKNEFEEAKVSREAEIIELQSEIVRLRDAASELNESCRSFEEKNKELLLEVESYRKSVDEVVTERNNIRKGFDEEKNKVKSLMLQVAGMEDKIEEMAGEIGLMRSEQEKVCGKNEMMESRVEVLTNEKDSLQWSLLEVQQECDDMRAKVEFSGIKSNRVLEMLKSTAELVCQYKEGVEEVVLKEQEPEEEIQLYAEQLRAIRDAFRSKDDKMVADMKQQSEIMQNSVAQAHKMKSLWTVISSASSILAVALAAYVAKGR